MHISGAAMIGGLADWYAVTALFTKPLGIPFKTAILPRKGTINSDRSHYAQRRAIARATDVLCYQKERVMVRIVEYGMSDVGQVQIRKSLVRCGQSSFISYGY